MKNPVIYNPQIQVGTSTRIALRLSRRGVPVDFTGCQATLKCGDLLSLDTASLDGLALGGTAGTITVTLSPAQSRALNFGSRPIATRTLSRLPNGIAILATGYTEDYRLDITSPDGTVTRAFVGSIVFCPED